MMGDMYDNCCSISLLNWMNEFQFTFGSFLSIIKIWESDFWMLSCLKLFPKSIIVLSSLIPNSLIKSKLKSWSNWHLHSKFITMKMNFGGNLEIYENGFWREFCPMHFYTRSVYCWYFKGLNGLKCVEMSTDMTKNTISNKSMLLQCTISLLTEFPF